MDIATRDAIANAILITRRSKSDSVSGYFQKAVLWQLWALDSSRNYLSNTRLAELLSCDPWSVSICLRLLEKHGYIRREYTGPSRDVRRGRKFAKDSRRTWIITARLTSPSSSASLSSTSLRKETVSAEDPQPQPEEDQAPHPRQEESWQQGSHPDYQVKLGEDGRLLRRRLLPEA